VNRTSRVLDAGELADVTPIWWRGAPSSPAPDQKNHAPVPNGVRRTQSAAQDAERERAERDAYQKGFSEGKTLAKEQAVAEMQPVMDHLGRALADLSTLRPRMRKEAEQDLLKLSIAIARRVLHRELTLDPESIEGLIKVALEKIQSRELCRVRVHPNQAQAIRASLERFGNSHNVELISDASLKIGDVLFETVHGTLDASIESQLREIERGFADRLLR